MPMDIRDVRSSLTHFVGNRAVELGYSDPTVLPGFSGLSQERPIWVIQSVPGGLPEYPLRNQTLQSYRFNIHFLTKDGMSGYSEAERWVAHVQNKLINNNWKITGRIIDFVYPKPRAVYRAGEGTLPAGDYYVSVAGISYIDDEVSLPCAPIHVNVPANNGRIRLTIPRYPIGFSWFKSFNVYQGPAANAMHLMTDSPVSENVNRVPTIFNIDNDDISISDVPPVSPSTIKFRFVDVIRDSFNAAVQPDPTKEAGTWMGSIFCVLRAPITTVTPEQAGAIEVINTDYDVEG